MPINNKMPPFSYLASFAAGLSTIAVTVRMELGVELMTEHDWGLFYGR